VYQFREYRNKKQTFNLNTKIKKYFFLVWLLNLIVKFFYN